MPLIVKWCGCGRFTRSMTLTMATYPRSASNITFAIPGLRTLARPVRAGCVVLALTRWRLVPGGGGLFSMPSCMHDHQEIEATKAKQFAGQRPCQMGERRRCSWASIGTESRQARAPLRGRGAPAGRIAEHLREGAVARAEPRRVADPRRRCADLEAGPARRASLLPS